jgi:hypothetical protein
MAFNSLKTMKVIYAFAVTASVGLTVRGQSLPGKNHFSESKRTSTYSVAERGPHHCVRERVENEPAAGGQSVASGHRYTELETGMHYFESGKRLGSNIIGLSHFDSVSGKAVMIAELKECVPQIAAVQQLKLAELCGFALKEKDLKRLSTLVKKATITNGLSTFRDGLEVAGEEAD